MAFDYLVGGADALVKDSVQCNRILAGRDLNFNDFFAISLQQADIGIEAHFVGEFVGDVFHQLFGVLDAPYGFCVGDADVHGTTVGIC